MSKHNHNYSQYSNKNRENKQNNNTSYNKPVEKPVVKAAEIKPVPTQEVVQPKPQLVQETVETATLPATVEGMVVNCARLNVRKEATTDSGIVCVLDSMSEIQVDVNKSTNKWVYVYTATGLEGYCMREYIDARL